jgi:hypothetical protein
MVNGPPYEEGKTGVRRLAGLTFAFVLLAVLVGSSNAAPEAWVRAAEQLEMPVFAPTITPKLKLHRVVPRKIECGEIKEELDGYYRGSDGRRLRIAEGQPYYCGDIGDAAVLGHPTIHGKRATLYAYCEGNGCQRASYTFALFWRERNVQIGLISRGTQEPTLLAIARSMRLVAE